MRHLLLFGMMISILFFAACKQVKKNDNPFFSEYQTPFGVPPFDKIDTSHFYPAFLEGMKQQVSEIEAIVNNQQDPTFENTVLAFG